MMRNHGVLKRCALAKDMTRWVGKFHTPPPQLAYMYHDISVRIHLRIKRFSNTQTIYLGFFHTLSLNIKIKIFAVLISNSILWHLGKFRTTSTQTIF